MREIKFKVWDKREKFMIKNVAIQNLTFKFASNKDHIFLQYIGLKDKNGKEIYEGDIIKIKAILVYERDVWDGQSGKYAGRQTFEKEVEYIRVIKSIFELGYIIHPKWADYKIELIGNIYENPELLKEVEK